MTLPAFTSELFAAELAAKHVSPQQRFIDRNPGAAIFLREKTTGLAMLAVSPGRVVLTLTGTIGSEHIVGILKDAAVPERLGSDAFNALIDISAFTGTINWSDIQAIVDVMPKGTSATNKNAYVVRNSLWIAVAKITAAFFKQTECSAFSSDADARAWLGWQ